MKRDENKYYYVGSNLADHPMAKAAITGILPPEFHPIMKLRKQKESHLPMVEGVVLDVGTIQR